MRTCRRPTSLVPTLQESGLAGRMRASHVTAYEQSRTVPRDFKDYWTSPDVRGALYGMQGRVCAYCSADIAEAGIDVEHFRPKGQVRGEENGEGYWWLAYEFSNYVLSCTVCNQKYKSNSFPMLAGAPRARYSTRTSLPAEGRLLFDPGTDPLDDWLTFEWQKPAGKIVPNPALPSPMTERVRGVIEFFRINRNVAHRKKRLALQKLVLQQIEAANVAEASRLAIRYQPHSIVARQILAETNPDSLPSPSQELQWLLEDLVADLLMKLEDLNETANSRTDEREAKELFWALATLWKDPPAEDGAFVESFLRRCNLRDDVAAFLEKLS